MKKISILASMAIAVATFTACGNSTPSADMQTDIDSLSYAFGLEQSRGVKNYLQQMEIDTTYIDEFVKGLTAGAQGVDDQKKAAYNAGIGVGQQITIMQKGFSRQLFADDSTKTLSMKNLLAGFIAGATGKDMKMTPESAREIGQRVQMSIQSQAAEKKFAVEKKKSDEFMANIAKQEGVKTLGQGVCYKVLKEGKGAIPQAGATVNINYVGKTMEGKEFDKHDGAKMDLNGTIAGFKEALTHMPVGSKWEVYIPYSAGYGHQQISQDLKPFSALIFTVELLGIEEAQKMNVVPQTVKP